ncbi:MAG: ferredoxin, partial [Prevotellaceae bacterium]|nr:ferredoxin [Prevotellaceae bacterium]
MKALRTSLAVIALLLVSVCSAQEKVYFTREITPEALVKIYKALGKEATGRVAVKISTGEPGGNNYLKPDLIRELVSEVGGEIVECNTAYGGRRSRTEDH